MSNKIAVIVDGYRIGVFLAPKLKKCGYRCINIASSPEFSSSCNLDDCLTNIINFGNVDEVARQLQKYPEIEFVIPGTESGVELADILSERLRLPSSNGTDLSEARRNKFKMIDTVAAAGLRTAKQIAANNVAEIIAWVRKLNEYPVVLKPLRSSGTEGVTFCFNERDIIAAFNNIYSVRSMYNVKNEQVLAQSYLHGTEYIVNKVSLKGQHYLSDMWEYKKIISSTGNPIYDSAKILPYLFEHREELVDYDNRVLDALELKYGSSHSEIILTADGPALVEVGARVMGSVSTDIISLAIGRNQMDLMIDSYTNPQKFLQQISEPYKIKKHLIVKLMISCVEGNIKNILHVEKIRQLPSFYSIDLKVKVGSHLNKTTDLLKIPGIIYLLHEDESVVQKDYETIAELEKAMFVV
jgi:biotin carboxylase